MSIDQDTPSPAPADDSPLGLDDVAPEETEQEGAKAPKRDWTEHWLIGDDPFFGVLGIAVTVGLMLWYFLHFGSLTSSIHNGYGDSAFDIGLYDQGVWLLSRFHAPFITLMGRNLFGDHTQFSLLTLVPFYWIRPDPTTLLYAQSFLLALGAWPVYMLAMRRLNEPIFAAVLAATYLFHPALAQSNLENFHPDAFAVPVVAFLLYFAIENKPKMVLVFAILALLCKEDMVLIVLPIAIWYAWRRNWRLGLAIAGGSILSALFMTQVVMRSLIGVPTLNTWRIPYDGPVGFVKQTLKKPADVAKYLIKEDHPNGRPFYTWQMIAPTGLMFIFAPEIALTMLLVLTSNVVSNFGYQHQIAYHYSMILLPSLAMGTVFGISVLKKTSWRAIAVVIVALSSAWTAYLWGPYPFSVHHTIPHWGADYSAVQAINKVKAQLPDDAVVSTYYSFAPHITHRERVYMWPTPFHAVYWNTFKQEGDRLPEADDVEYLLLPASLSDNVTVFDSIKDNFVEIAREQNEIGEGAALYKRKDLP